MGNTKPPPKSHVLADPYADWFTGKEADSPPPVPAPPGSGERTLMRFYVPSEHTELDFGHGNTTPGIRMATDRHAHITTRVPLTTISLGIPVGEDMGDPPGLLIYTEGEKSETIEKAVVENYKDTKSETVHSFAEEKFLANKTEIISGRHTQNLFDEHHFGVKKDAAYNFDANKTERIVGDSTMDVMGHKKETIHGDRNWLNKGNWVAVTIGAYNDLFVGEKLSVSFSANTT